jgi:hypothetical protein
MVGNRSFIVEDSTIPQWFSLCRLCPGPRHQCEQYGCGDSAMLKELAIFVPDEPGIDHLRKHLVYMGLRI